MYDLAKSHIASVGGALHKNTIAGYKTTVEYNHQTQQERVSKSICSYTAGENFKENINRSLIYSEKQNDLYKQ